MNDRIREVFEAADPPPLVVAEVGIAHGGSLQRALRYVGCVAEAGAEAVKFQTHIAAEEMVPDHPWYDTIERCSLTEEEEGKVQEYADVMGLVWFSTPFSVAAVERLERLGTPLYKIGSGELTHRPLLEAVRDTGKPVILSSGLHTERETYDAEDALDPRANIAVLHCVSAYPPGSYRGLLCYGDATRDGISDHTPDILTGLGAAALGARVIEKHVKLADTDPDAEVAISMGQLADLVKGARLLWEARQPLDVDQSTTDLARIARHDRRDDWRREA